MAASSHREHIQINPSNFHESLLLYPCVKSQKKSKFTKAIYSISFKIINIKLPGSKMIKCGTEKFRQRAAAIDYTLQFFL